MTQMIPPSPLTSPPSPPTRCSASTTLSDLNNTGGWANWPTAAKSYPAVISCGLARRFRLAIWRIQAAGRRGVRSSMSFRNRMMTTMIEKDATTDGGIDSVALSSFTGKLNQISEMRRALSRHTVLSSQRLIPLHRQEAQTPKLANITLRSTAHTRWRR
jgi:hypothetical protein